MQLNLDYYYLKQSLIGGEASGVCDPWNINLAHEQHSAFTGETHENKCNFRSQIA